MNLNSGDDHQCHTIADFFEVQRAKSAVLLCIRPDLIRRKVFPEERPNLNLRGRDKTKRFGQTDKKPIQEINRETDAKNLEDFFHKYPALEEQKLENLD